MSQTNKAIVQEVNESFNQSDLDGFLSHCSEHIRWTIVGKEPLVGKEAIAAFLGKVPTTPAMRITTHNIIGDDEIVACDGRMEMQGTDDGAGYKGAFCDVYHFEGGKIITLDSYVVDIRLPTA